MRGIIMFLGALLAGGLMAGSGCAQGPPEGVSTQVIPLPPPELLGEVSVEEALARRRSRRDFSGEELGLRQISQLLWAAQGITDEGLRLRSAPSAGATYPLEVLIVVGSGGALDPGIYRFLPSDHGLQPESPGDRRAEVAAAALDQGWIADAPVVMILAADISRTAARYGDRARRYVHMEVGHAAQNVYLQAEALNLATTVVGAFRDGELAELLGLPAEEEPLAILPVGHVR
ncbi:MAG: SagB/ThcOx family dehydrogenase [Gemmatimonadales bacterium]|nr:MAG: SagB/ThcOx family dehydrogenase [Gemmatimonadales bacterium]